MVGVVDIAPPSVLRVIEKVQNMKNVYIDKRLTSGDAARKLIAVNQHAYAKARGTAALAHMVAEGFVTIKKIWANLSPADQAAILDEFGIAPADERTSAFTPWIKLLWGEHDPDPKKVFRDSSGEQRQLWVPDRSMEVYHHTMEELERLGVHENHASIIMEHGGAHKMASKRKERLRKEEQPARAADEQIKRDLFLRETSGQWVSSEIPIPEGAGEYVTVVCRRNENELQLLGVASKDAKAQLTKLACDSYEGLVSAIEQRKREERIRAEAVKEAEQKLVTMDPEAVRRMYAKLQEAAVSK